jgi:solute carrier family 13 (sodium-dependent dicarboxylate transporter), member 2/3/5
MTATATLNDANHYKRAMTFTVPFREYLPALICGLIALALIFTPTSLDQSQRIVLATLVLSIGGWAFTSLPDSLVAITAALVLAVTGTISEQQLFAALGHDLVWLLIAAFVMAGALKGSGLIDILITKMFARVNSVTGLFATATTAIIATAFFIPSTSGRAALLLPVFIALASRVSDKRLVKPLALLFPTVILLSAGGTLIGAGAHMIAADAMTRTTGQVIGYARWIWLALPFSILISFAAMALIIHMFVPRNAPEKALAAAPASEKAGWTKQHGLLLAVIAFVVVGWCTTPWHGLSIATVAVAGAALMLVHAISNTKSKDLFKAVEVELIVFLAAATIMADAVVETKLDAWLASALLNNLSPDFTTSAPLIYGLLAIVAIASHILVNSRSARAAILIPAVALPIAALGHDPMIVIMIAVLGTGFCQTTMASAKPVALFGNAERETFDAADLLRLAPPLAATTFALLMVFANLVWPIQTSEPMEQTPASTTLTSSGFTVTTPAAVSSEPLRASGSTICSPEKLEIAMTAFIGERRMWARGWWHVHRAMRKAGYDVSQDDVKSVYRGKDLVTLRAKSIRLANVMANPQGLADAQKVCRTKD